MNPFKTTTNLGRSLKKKANLPSASRSNEVLTPATTPVRKPFHQIYLEEISRKSRSCTHIEASESLTSSKSSPQLSPAGPTATVQVQLGPNAAIPNSTRAIPKSTGVIPKSTGAIPKSTGAIPKSTGAIPKSTGTIPKPTEPPSSKQTFKRVPFKAKKFEVNGENVSKEPSHRKYFSKDSSAFGPRQSPTLPFCLKGADPCACVPECNTSNAEPLRGSRDYKRRLPNSPPTQKRVAIVRQIFENTPTPPAPVARPTTGESKGKVKEIIKQLVRETEKNTSAVSSKSLRKKGKAKVTDNSDNGASVSKQISTRASALSSEKELCDALKALSISETSELKLLRRSEHRQAPKGHKKWQPISLSDLYEKGKFGPESISLVKIPKPSPSQKFHKPLSLTELYTQANLPLSPSSGETGFKVERFDNTLVLSLPELYKQADLVSGCPTLHSKSTSSLKKSKHSAHAADSYCPLSVEDIYKQASLSPKSSTTDTKHCPRLEKVFGSKSRASDPKTFENKDDKTGAIASRSATSVLLTEHSRESHSPLCSSRPYVDLSSSSMPEVDSLVTTEVRTQSPKLEQQESPMTGLQSSSTNYIDLSSYVTAEPQTIVSVSRKPGKTSLQASSPNGSVLYGSSSKFKSDSVIDLTSYCLPDTNKKSSTSMDDSKSGGETAKRKRLPTNTQETKCSISGSTREELSKTSKDVSVKRHISIPKRTSPRQYKNREDLIEIILRRLESAPLERAHEEQILHPKGKSVTETDLEETMKILFFYEEGNNDEAIISTPENQSDSSPSALGCPSPSSNKAGNGSNGKTSDSLEPVLRPELDMACGGSSELTSEVDTQGSTAVSGGSSILASETGAQGSTGSSVNTARSAQPKTKKFDSPVIFTYPEMVPIPSTSKDREKGSSPFVIPKYMFTSPQSGSVFVVEEWEGPEGETLPDVSLSGSNQEQPPPPPSNNADGLDIIFSGLEAGYYFEERAYYEEDEYEDDDEPYEDDDDPSDADDGLGQGGGADSPDLEFIFDDSDSHGNEIAELYSYTEQPELQLNVRAFEDQMEIYSLPPSWQRLSVEQRRSVVMKLLNQLECSNKPIRMRGARCLLYIAQGCWAEVQSDTEQQHWTRLNALLLFQLGAFSAFTDLLNIEIDNSTAAHVAMRKIAVSLADSQDLRVILSVLYIITEVIRNENLCENSEYKSEIEAFVIDIGHANGEDHLVIKLLSMVTRFCSGAAPHFPMKKVLLLLWKVILVSLGGMKALKEQKAEKRRRANLPPQDEDTMEIAKTMRSSSPPASASDLLEAQNQKRSTRPFRRSLMKQSSLDDQESLGMEMESSMASENGDDIADMTEYDERRPTDNSETSQMFNNHILNMYNMQVSPPPQHDVVPRGLPWKPKVRQRDIDCFLDTSRQKFLGYSLPGDQTTLFGLPEPIHEGVRILKEHVYTSLAELQIQKEEDIARNPLSTKEEEIDLTPAELLYQAMIPNLPQYMIALLKILLAAAPTSKAKTDSINIMADVLPEEMPMTVVQSMKLGIDVNRHKEIIVKAVSAILLLLLKHFKLNHIYQFEFMSQHLVFANCIPLVLKFFNQNIMGYIGARNVIPILDFPSCVIGDQPELTADGLEIGDAAPFSWRNMYSCINLLRILNKLTKWKHSRIMMLVVFKSAPILKRTLKIRHAMTQLYVLKLLKMQTKYLGRQWRKSNMKTISAIYQKVRHRLNDDWAYGNDLDARPWDFQAEECALRASVDRFNNRRYTQVVDSDFEPVDNNPSSVLGQPHELSDNFKQHYSLWLEQEVHSNPINWEELLGDDKSDDKKDDEQ